jgi:arylsulfatase A-like enzyme
VTPDRRDTRRPARRARVGSRLLLAVTLVIAALVLWRALRPHEAPLPPTISTEEVVRELAPGRNPAAGGAQGDGDPLRTAIVRPGDPLKGQGGRPALLAPSPSRFHFRIDVPADAALAFAVAVERAEASSATRFAVAVDGREVWTRTVDPASARTDRRWFDEHLDLSGHAGRTVDLDLVAAATSPGLPSGKAGWANVRLVRTQRHPRQAGAPERPNVLVLLVDTLRADALGTYGATPSPSPNLDRFAAGGQVFEQATAQAPWTLPSVATLFTGLYPRSHGAVGETGDVDANAVWGFLADSLDTIAERATRAGITTFGVSTNPIVSSGTNLSQGFERFVELTWQGKQRNWESAATVNRLFLDWLGQNRGWRFFAYLHYMEPHDPYTPPREFRPPRPPGIRDDLAEGRVLGISKQMDRGRAVAISPEESAYLRALYDGEIRSWDEELGMLLDALGRLGVQDSTVVIVTADHGEEFMEHGLLTHRKHLYEESIHVPLVLRGPGIAAGRRGEQVQGIDLYPTLAALLGLDVPADLPGMSLLGALPARTAICEVTRGRTRDGQRDDLVAARTPTWKVIDALGSDADESYDLANDPAERTALPAGSGAGPALQDALTEFAKSAPPPPEQDRYDPDLRDKLRALGYTD